MSIRYAAATSLLLAASTAAAAPCATTPMPSDAAPHGHALEVVASAPTDHTSGLAAAAGSVFPAISDDGKTIVALYDDRADFSDAPITSVVWFGATGARVAMLSAGGPTPVRDVAAAINAQLAKSTWRTLPKATTCSAAVGDAGVQRSTAVFADGHTFVFDAATGTLTTTLARGAAKPRVQKPKLEPIGTRTPDDGSKQLQPCGEVRALDQMIWSPTASLLIVVPSGNLGGDACGGSSAGARATAIVI